MLLLVVVNLHFESRRPVAMAYLIVAFTASMLGVYFAGSDNASPPK